MSKHAAAKAKASTASPSVAPSADMRLDKWLWVARFFKTRGMAAEEVDKGRVQVNGHAAKPARSVRVNDLIEIKQPGSVRELLVLGLGTMRGPATVARTLYQETAASVLAQQQAAEARKFGIEPANAQELGRPTKRDRRDLVDWQRWSASVDDQ
jgi:ribosome-associated heat shock protein Hsp15